MFVDCEGRDLVFDLCKMGRKWLFVFWMAHLGRINKSVQWKVLPKPF